MIKLIDPGFYTNFQDKGRFGFRHLGVPLSGPMDPKAFALANALLPLTNEQTVIECTLTGPTLEITLPVRFVVTGAAVPIDLNEQKLAMNQVHLAPKNSILKLGKVTSGMRFYLRFEACFDLPTYFKSISFYAPLGSPARLKKGEVFMFMAAPKEIASPQHARVTISTTYIQQLELKVTPGPDWDQLTQPQQKQLLAEKHLVLAQDRMGYRLSSSLNVAAPQLLSQLVFPGMVQLTPSGELLIAMADCQVTGGYLQILQLSTEAIAVLAQKREGESLTFQSTLLQTGP